MRKKRSSDNRSSDRKAALPDARERNIERRTALKTLGAFALYGPALASIACDGDPEGKDTDSNPAASGSDSGATPAAPDAGSSTPVSATGSDSGAPTANNPGNGGGKDSGAAATPDAAATGAQDAGGDAASSAIGDAGASSSGFFPPIFTDAPMCTLTATDSAGEGPFFLHEDEVMTDPTLKRVDIRDGHPGVELQLNYRLLDADGDCMKPIADVEVYTWHTDALGMYSGFNGQNPDKTYSGGGERTVENEERFCRGVQVTNAEGVCSFRSVYPGWYFGRPIHIHFVALKKGSMAATSSYRSPMFHIFTTQLYFEEAFSRKIHEGNAPYTTRTSGSGYATYVKPNAQSTVRPSARMEGNVVVASLNIITKASASRR